MISGLTKEQINIKLEEMKSYLRVKERANVDKKGNWWVCECKCGNKTIAVAPKLTFGHVKSCGCLKKEKPIRVNLVGNTYGRLTLLERLLLNGRVYYKCLCVCGSIKNISGDSVKNTKSCGCWTLEKTTKHGHTKKHGAKQSRPTTEYLSWRGIKDRCLNKKNKAYKNYGGRGISICERWLSSDGFKNFISDMGFKPGKEYSIDRKDVNGNYEPSNCTWVLKSDQERNKRRSINFHIDGIKYNLYSYCKNNNLNYNTVSLRIKKGRSVLEAVQTPTILPFKEYKLTDLARKKKNFKTRKSIFGYNRLEDDLTFDQWEEILKENNYRCKYFDKWPHLKENNNKITVDHIIPKSKGGFDTKSNVQPLCVCCNSSKSINGEPKPPKQ